MTVVDWPEMNYYFISECKDKLLLAKLNNSKRISINIEVLKMTLRIATNKFIQFLFKEIFLWHFVRGN